MTSAQYGQGFSQISNPEWMWGSLITADQATIYASFFLIWMLPPAVMLQGGQKNYQSIVWPWYLLPDVRKTLFRNQSHWNQHFILITTKPSTMYPHTRKLGSRLPIYACCRNVPDRLRHFITLVAARMLMRAQWKPWSKPGTHQHSAGYIKRAVIAGRNLVAVEKDRTVSEADALMDIKRLKTGLHRATGAGNHGSPSLIL